LNQNISAALAFLKRVAKFPLHPSFKVRWNRAACAIASAITLGLRRRATQLQWDTSLNIYAQLVFVTRVAAKYRPHTLILLHRLAPIILWS
jgi:hypothetical protein